ncbi:actin-like protein Arp5p [Cantharellus anzutake]|uniref:actin-like protein Arp5p n=1 Tax=Cantharellus anzutake TaxID=1750568 RepID=UPI001902DA16|nr:actin-like protein Arp5p [Cantharellus anzutake]KAF8323004.1 actin-like protein Arp5p [Cantharellus anzutake]
MSVHYLPSQSLLSLDSFETDYRNTHFAAKTPIVIDNGSTDLRYGFATSGAPFSNPNMFSKYKDRRSGKMLGLFGAAAEVDGPSRGAAKSPWEAEVLLNAEALEGCLDYAFLKLGLDDDSVSHPVIMSERFCTPLANRRLMSELLFECYSVPRVVYAVDALLSHAYNCPEPSAPQEGLVISFNTSSTSVIPFLNGRGVFNQAKRLPWGGSQASEYLLKLLNLKYSGFPTKITPQHATWMLHNFFLVSSNYVDTIRQLKVPSSLSAANIIVQFPFTITVYIIGEEKTEEELARIAERRREAGRRLQEQAAKVRSEKMLQREQDLDNLLAIRELRSKDKKSDYAARLKAEGVESDAMLDDIIKKLQTSIKRAKRKEEGQEEEIDAETTFPLVDVPDHKLDEEQLKEKKRQRLMKAAHEARQRAKKEKEREKELKEEFERREEQEREQDFQSWSLKMRRSHQEVMNRIKERKKRRAQIMDRKSAVSQTRMKHIVNLADEVPADKKRKKAGAEDMFGENDDDWLIYRQVSLENASDEEEEDLATLTTIESKLLSHDPSFTTADTYSAITTRRSALMSAFRPKYEEGDTEGIHRVHLNIERWRVPEAWFGPGAAGVDSAGLSELIENILKSFAAEERSRIVKDVFLTGGPAMMPGFTERLQNSLRPILAPDTPFTVRLASDPRIDAWKGMASFARSSSYTDASTSKDEYFEFGGERTKRWWGGNWNAAV